jgi:hypothetical protein
MDGVAVLLANNGVFTPDGEDTPKPRRSMVKRGALLGATLMFISFFLTLAILPQGGKEPVLVVFFLYWVALMVIIGASGYLKRLIANIFNLFSEEEPSLSKKSASPRGPALPGAQSAPVADSGRQFVETTKMGHPSSITEQTTSRLNNV